MNTWIRLLSTEEFAEPWHLRLGVSPGWLRVAHCGGSYILDDELQTRPFDDTPSNADLCETCNVASRRLSR